MMNKMTAATAAIAPRAKTSGSTQLTPPPARSDSPARLDSSDNAPEDSKLLSDAGSSGMDSSADSGAEDSSGGSLLSAGWEAGEELSGWEAGAELAG